MAQSYSTAGLAYSVSASLLFGITPWYVQLLAPLDGTILFWNRVVFSTLVALVALTGMRQWSLFRQMFNSPRHLLATMAGTLIMSFQWWVFVWAPVNNHTTELSLGYFLLPLTLALTGRVLYKEQLSTLQLAAIVFAGIGVLSEIIQQGQWPWLAIAIAGLYHVYFVIKRYAGFATLPSFLFECLLVFPIAVFILSRDSEFLNLTASRPDLWLLLPGLGLLCCLSFFFYLAASRQLPVSLFGLLTYLEPAIIFVIAIVILKEPFTPGQWLTYGFIGIAATLVSLDSLKLLRSRARIHCG